ncbi:nucleotidyltransferase domain-containing protein [candidate division KSB1 bacterium]|nr:nucleotidyltransferase domain-containing protein [candidate division KSB1 bacterium]
MRHLIKAHSENLKTIFLRNHVLFAYLFGSVVREQTNKMSDIDFAVYFQETFSADVCLEHRLNLILELNNTLKHPIDILVLNNRYDELVLEVLKNGSMIYKQDAEALREFRYRFTRQYLDFLPYREIYYEFMLERIETGTDTNERVQQHKKSIEELDECLSILKRIRDNISKDEYVAEPFY